MQTLFLKVDPERPGEKEISLAAGVLKAGGLVAFPTETVYGLGADALNSKAVAGIFTAKGRPSDNPLIVHVASPGQVERVAAQVPELAKTLMARFWPGPLTLVLPKREGLPGGVTAGLPTVAVRMPDHPVALALLRAAGVPVAAPSANLSGSPSPTRAEDVLQDLEGRVEVILDGGPCRIGLESTVLDLTGVLPVILRPGGLSREDLAYSLGRVELDPAVSAPLAENEVPRSPGLKYRHYAPKARLFLVGGEGEAITAKMQRLAGDFLAEGEKVAILVSSEGAAVFRKLDLPLVCLEELGSKERPEEAAARLFTALRACDAAGASVILAETFPEGGLGEALMNRLRKAASFRVL